MTAKDYTDLLLSHFPHQPTADQEETILHLAHLIASSKTNPVYILKGYAGTGKTSLLSAVVASLKEKRIKTTLLAPTGRAAKVLANYSSYPAHTIHRLIYIIADGAEEGHRIMLAPNKKKNAVFIVDEASMIGDNTQQNDNVFSQRNLLDDLVSYVFSQPNNKLILVGDIAQLPPVGLSLSPALNLQMMKNSYPITGFSFEMKTVMRQANDSGILASATYLRQKLSEKDTDLPLFNTSFFKEDVFNVDNGYDLEELLQDTYNESGASDGIVVCRSNKRANMFNNQVRSHILGRDSEIEAGDKLMVVKNNYYWLDQQSKIGFIANGDLAEVLRVKKRENCYGFEFADADIRLLDYPDEKELEVKLLLDTLQTESAGLSQQDQRKLYAEVETDFANLPNKRQRYIQMLNDPFYNALHVKYAYAFTCHKTQGGQWPNVFIDQGYLTEEMMDTEYLRWLYTAITRATGKVYLVNFREEFYHQ